MKVSIGMLNSSPLYSCITLALSAILVYMSARISSRLLALGERTGAIGASLASYGFILLGSSILLRAIALLGFHVGGAIGVIASSILLIAGFVGEALGAATIAVGVLYASGYTRLSGIWLVTAILASLVTTVYASLHGSFMYFIAINTVVEAPSFLAVASTFHESWRRGNNIDEQAFFGFALAAIAPVASSLAATLGVIHSMIVSNILLLGAAMYILVWSRKIVEAVQRM